MTWRRGAAFALLGALGPLLTWGLAATAQQQPGAAGARSPRVTASRFEFEVIESFDARYLGDTPGHHGKNGGLENLRPNVALGDPVFRGNTRVGRVTRLLWDRGRGSLEVEFDPEPLQRVGVGDIVWLALDGAPPAGAGR